MGKKSVITIKMLSQIEADQLIKDLQKEGGEAFRGFLISFDGEKERMLSEEKKTTRRRRLLWALPASERVYYIAKYEGKPYLLVGMHSNDTISSIAKITSSLSGKGGECLKELIEKALVYKCYAGVIYINFSENCDPHIYELLQELKEDLPNGIEKIYVYHDTASIICKVKSSAVWDEKTA
jgi:hypothetical protein